MDTAKAFVVAAQMCVPVIFAWQLFKSERWCRRYEKMLERQHRSYLESMAKVLGIALIENETTDELFARIIRIGKWRRGEDGKLEG